MAAFARQPGAFGEKAIQIAQALPDLAGRGALEPGGQQRLKLHLAGFEPPAQGARQEQRRAGRVLAAQVLADVAGQEAAATA